MPIEQRGLELEAVPTETVCTLEHQEGDAGMFYRPAMWEFNTVQDSSRLAKVVGGGPELEDAARCQSSILANAIANQMTGTTLGS